MADQKNFISTFFRILMLTLFLSFCFSGNAGAQSEETTEASETTKTSGTTGTVETKVQALSKGKTCTVTGYYKVVSSKESVAKVEKTSSKNYTVTAMKSGKATLCCYNKNEKLKAKIYLLVTTKESFTYNNSSIILKEGNTKKVTAKTNIASGITIKYVSSNNGVATVNTKGKIKAVAPGTATISAKFFYRDTRVKTIKKVVHVYSCSYDKTTLTLVKGDAQKVQATASKGCTVKYSSSNKKVAKVNKNGKITAMGTGTAVITVGVYYGDQKVQTIKKTVKVKKKRGKNDPLRILFVGNSKTYTNDIPGKFAGIAQAMGEKVEVSSVTRGGETLLYIAQNMKSQIKAQEYDCVILQEHTDNMTNYSEYLEGAKKIANYVKEENPNVKIFVRKCWLKNNSSSNAINLAYTNTEKVAKKIGAMVINDGPAFDLCRQKYPSIPLFADTKHPSKQGSYLSACCAYAAIFNESPVGCQYKGDISSRTRAEHMQKIAETVTFSAGI